jgi:radical SAM superfamily enzyme YgiQ (UPF0313 family)
MKITFITPHVGRKNRREYVRTWQMEPLTIATLAGLTPPDVEIAYYDERIEAIDYDSPTDLVAITVETYTAKRAYEIAAEYYRRGVRVVLGGYHVTLLPGEAQQYADSILVGYAEPLWETVVRDAERGTLRRRYESRQIQSYDWGTPRRDLFSGRPYFKLSCVETGRGCPLRCNFCSIAAATSSRYYARPVESIVREIDGLKNRQVFFVEDNFVGNLRHARELCDEIARLKIRWVGQGTLNMARDEALLEAMARSGCAGVLIGFESLNAESLRLMDKKINTVLGDYRDLIARLHQYGIALYGTFIFGYDSDRPEDVLRTAEAAIEFGLFIAAFNHLLPFPGTPLYEQFRESGRLTDERWWLSPSFRFGDVPFEPAAMTARELHERCIGARRRFYSLPGILRRATNLRGNCHGLRKSAAFVSINGLLRKEIDQKDGLPLGDEPVRPQPLFPAGELLPVLTGR